MRSLYKQSVSLIAMLLLALLFASNVEAQTVGNCAVGKSDKRLDINNVNARILNIGGLFWNGDPSVYTVPKGGKADAIFAGGFWIGGYTPDGKLHLAAATYGTWEFWPGPLDANANPPADCSKYDRIYKVSVDEIKDYEATGKATSDIAEWPYTLGAPVKDGDKNPNNYNLAGGDRPDITGDQMLWWVMNDVGNKHLRTQAEPVGVEMQVSAFAFRQAGDLGNMTFYRYKVLYKGKQPLNNAVFSIWSDVDMGSSSDDYVGSDTTLGLGYVYNADENDEGDAGYGFPPPAIGYDFFKGPIIKDAAGKDKILGMGAFHYFLNGSAKCGDPAAVGLEYYYSMTAKCKDGTPLTVGGNGATGTGTLTKFAFHGDPVTGKGWSEDNVDGKGGKSPNGDRRFVQSTVPFTLQPGSTQEVVYGIVWARAAKGRLASLAKLKLADRKAQALFDNGFIAPTPIDPPSTLSVNSNDGQIFLTWDWATNTNNYADSFKDTKYGYDLEGYIVKEYTATDDIDGKVIAVYDKNNGLRSIYDVSDDDPLATAQIVGGSDSGLQHYHIVDGVTNYTDRYFGVQAYSYYADGVPKVQYGIEKRIVYTPTNIASRNGGTQLVGKVGDAVNSTSIGAATDGSVTASVVDPTALTGDEYQVYFYNTPLGTGTTIGYDIKNMTKNTIVFDGKKAIAATGAALPLGAPIATAEGLSFTVNGAPFAFKRFTTVANAAGPISPAQMGAFAFNSSGFPTLDGKAADGVNDRPLMSKQQVSAGAGLGWGVHTFSNSTAAAGTGSNGTRAGYAAFIDRSTNSGGLFPQLVPYDFEWRFKGTTSVGYNYFGNAKENESYDVPFELWMIGAGTPNDTKDDVRMIPYMLSNGPDGAGNSAVVGRANNSKFDLSGADHEISGGADDPYTDAVYWVMPADKTPGESGYKAYAAAVASHAFDDSGTQLLRRTVLVLANGGSVTPYARELPENGTIFRIETTKPNVPGVVHKLETKDLKVLKGDATLYSLDNIGVTPNPYKGASAYETQNIRDEVRFTNLPDQCTIRIFTVDGTLVKTLVHNNNDGFLKWDLANEQGLRLASGMYLAHVDVPGVGEKILKLGVVRKKIQLTAF
jgi:hypothetical protein